MNTLIINLKHRQDRFEHITNEIKKLSNVISNVYRVEAIIDETRTAFKSHKQCIRIAKERKWPYVLILEDDAMFEDNANDILLRSVNEIQNHNWDVLYLGASLLAHTTRVSDCLIKLTHAYALHAYIVNSQMYDTILNLPQIYEMDVHYNLIMPQHNMYMCDPMIAYQMPNYSDLQNGYRDYNAAMKEAYSELKPR